MTVVRETILAVTMVLMSWGFMVELSMAQSQQDANRNIYQQDVINAKVELMLEQHSKAIDGISSKIDWVLYGVFAAVGSQLIGLAVQKKERGGTGR